MTKYLNKTKQPDITNISSLLTKNCPQVFNSGYQIDEQINKQFFWLIISCQHSIYTDIYSFLSLMKKVP